MDALGRNFGLLIAFVLPGFLFLVGLPHQAVAFGAVSLITPNGLSMEGFLILLPASAGCGVILSAIRWLFVDALLHRTGIERPNLNFHSIPGKLDAYNLFVEHNYRYYQFYANCLIAVILLLGVHWRMNGRPTAETLLWSAVLCIVLALAARDCLGRFVVRTRLILGELRDPRTSAKAVKHGGGRRRKR